MDIPNAKIFFRAVSLSQLGKTAGGSRGDIPSGAFETMTPLKSLSESFFPDLDPSVRDDPMQPNGLHWPWTSSIPSVMWKKNPHISVLLALLTEQKKNIPQIKAMPVVISTETLGSQNKQQSQNSDLWKVLMFLMWNRFDPAFEEAVPDSSSCHLVCSICVWVILKNYKISCKAISQFLLLLMTNSRHNVDLGERHTNLCEV